MLKLATRLSHAILHNQFILCYQPQFDLASGALIGVEALVRWRHPAQGIMLPDEFIPIAERTGLIVSLGEWVLQTACEQFAKWKAQGLHVPRLAINIASRQLEEADIVTRIFDILKKTKIPLECLEIELTETGRAVSLEGTQRLSQLQAKGIKIALDDFGMGCSNFQVMRFIPLTHIKLAQLYIDGIGTNPIDEAIIQMVIGLAQKLHLKVIAEGVDTLAKKEFLLANKCHEVQGHYFSVPLSAEEFFNAFHEK